MAYEIVETAHQDEVILVIDAARLRKIGIDDRFRSLVSDLVMGTPVAGCEMDHYGVSALEILTAEERAAREQQADLFDYERAH